MTSTGRGSRPRRRPASARRWLLASALVPLALVSAVLVPVASAAPAGARAAGGIQDMRSLRLPGLAGSATVTLITGDRVRLSAVGGGRYSVTASPARGGSSQVDFSARGSSHGAASLQAVPSAAVPLISTGQVSLGLFDVGYLARHGDTGPSARIPVTLRYASNPGAVALRRDAARLPGAMVVAAESGGEVRVSVAASRAAAFWAALTGSAPAAPAGLAGGVSQVWLTGHQSRSTGDAAPQDGQPVYTVTETITRTTGPVDAPDCLGWGGPLATPFCLDRVLVPALVGVAGAGEDVTYPATNGYGTCVRQRAAKPVPVCTAWQLTYSVPAGIYFAHALGAFLSADNPDHTLESATAELDVPQLTVTGNTAIRLNADKAVPFTVSTPRPGVDYGFPDTMEATRWTADGGYYINGVQGLFPGHNNWWAVPTPAGEGATVGSFHFSPERVLGAREVSAAVTAPGHLTLHPTYACGEATGTRAALDGEDCGAVRFTGRRTLQLVNAGTGTASDFAKISVRGKLAFITEPATCAGFSHCAEPGWVLWEQLASARKAGAAGVLTYNPSQPDGYPNPLPSLIDTLGANGAAEYPRMPVISIDAAEGTAVLRLLAKGPVRITVSDSGPSSYLYFLWFNQQRRIPASLHYTLTAAQLAAVAVSYHARTASAAVSPEAAAWHPDDFDVGGLAAEAPGPGRLTEYYGPLSPDLVWMLQGYGAITRPAPRYGGWALKVFGQHTNAAVDWNEPLLALGAAAPSTPAYQAQPGRWTEGYCSGCRQGNTFYPLFDLVDGASPATNIGQVGFAPGSIHLYNRGGQQIQPTPFQGITTYQLAAGRARYRLVTPTTTWGFTSSRPSADQTPAGTLCVGTAYGTSTAPCQADPLVFLRYDAGLSLRDTVTPGTDQLQVTGYHLAPAAPAVTSLRVWISTDGGARWRPARVAGGRGGAFTATYTVPASGTNGHVSIKAQATDGAGDSITQTLINAYGIAAARHAAA